ncbi:hypothetical protein NDA03_26385 [Trichocoleus sp. Lan]|uniref:PLAT/LH2 domain-containing protein n=1 Tax=Trichocoleus sp. Lan TaxID=2933927 RepID=UPI0032996CF8
MMETLRQAAQFLGFNQPQVSLIELVTFVYQQMFAGTQYPTSPSFVFLRNTLSDLTIYDVTVKTGNVVNAGTTANVFIFIGGGKSWFERKLNSSVTDFAMGQTSKFSIPAFKLSKETSDSSYRVIIWHDNSGTDPSWYLESITIQNRLTNQIMNFPCNRWLARNKGDCAINLFLDHEKAYPNPNIEHKCELSPEEQPDENTPPPPSVEPVISVSSKGDGSFVVDGSHFLPNAKVYIRVVDDELTNLWLNTTSTQQGTFSFPTGKLCKNPGALAFSANDGRPDKNDLTGTLWSNTITVSCPMRDDEGE